MVLLGIDRSHWNAEPDFPTFRAHGGSFVITKATDGTGGKDVTYDACRAATHAAGLVFGGYHFAEWGNVTNEANWYLSQAKPRPGELIALDAEAAIPAGVDVVAWVAAWSKIVHAATGCWPLLYTNGSWLLGHNWAPVVALGDGLWLAKYDGLPTGGPIGQWPLLAMKQFTDRAVFPGEPGTIDEDAFQGDLAALLRYAVPAVTPTPPPPPPPPPPPVPPTPGGLFMTLSASEEQEVLAAARVLVQQVCGELATPLAPFPGPTKGGGWPAWDNSNRRLTVVDFLRAAQAQTATPPVVTLTSVQVEQLKASLVADPAFQTLLAGMAAQVVAALDADLSQRFGPKAL